jgi:hypothetical protein
MAAISPTGVPQLTPLLGHVPKENRCSEGFDLVKIARMHRYTFRREVVDLAAAI